MGTHHVPGFAKVLGAQMPVPDFKNLSLVRDRA